MNFHFKSFIEELELEKHLQETEVLAKGMFISDILHDGN